MFTSNLFKSPCHQVQTSLIPVVLLTLFASTSPTWAVNYYLATDVPATLGGTDYTTNQIVRSQNATYVLDTALPAGTELVSLHRKPDGTWLFSPDQTTTLSATDFEPRDLVSYDGVTFTMFLDGSALNIPDSARIDSLLLDSLGSPVLSFDAPTNISK